MSYAYNKKRGKRAAKARATETSALRQKYREAFVHMTPLQKSGFLLKRVLDARV